MSGTAEVGRVEFTIGADASEFTSKIVDARQEVNRFTGVVQNQLNATSRSFEATEKKVQELQAEIRRLNAENEKMRGALGHIARELTNMSRQLTNVGDSGQRAFRPMENLISRVRRELGHLLAAYVGFQTVRGTFSIIAELQELEDQIGRVSGEAGSATRVMTELTELFRGHGVDIRNAGKAYVELVQGGLRPTRENMIALANISATVGADVDKVAQAMRAAARGQFDQLRELGVRVQQVGNQLKVTFQGVTTTVQNSASGIEQALRNIGAEQLRGASAEANGLNDAFQRLKSAGDRLAQALGDSGLAAEIARTISKVSELFDKIGPLAEAIGVVLTGAFKLANAAIDLFLAGLDSILAGIRAIITLAQTGSFTEAMNTLGQGLQQVFRDFERRQQNSAGTATPDAPSNPGGLVGGGSGVRTAANRRRGGGGGERIDSRIKELQGAIEQLNREAASAETSAYEAAQQRLNEVVERMKAAGGELARQAAALEGQLNVARLRRNQALQDRAIEDMREENNVLKARLNLGEREAELTAELNALRRQGVQVTQVTIDNMRIEIARRRELEEAIKEQTQRQQALADGLSDAFGRAFEAAIEPGAKLSDILKQLERDLLSLGTRILILEPLQKMLRELINGPSGGDGTGGIMGMIGKFFGMMGGGGIGGGAEVVGDLTTGASKFATAAASALPGVSGMPTGFMFHEGGRVGSGGQPVGGHPSQWATAPKFYVGLAANEFRAILERGEVVLNNRQQKAVAAAASSNKTEIHIHGVANPDEFNRSRSQILARVGETVARSQRAR